MKTSFTDDMKNMREKLGFSQIDLSKGIGISKEIISMNQLKQQNLH